MFLRNVYFHNIIRRYKILLLVLLLMPWNLLADENFRQYYSFVGENFKITSEGENFSPAIASNGKDIFLVVYYRKNTNDFDIYGTRVTVDGEVLDPDGIPISTAPGDQMFPSVTWNGENFFVVWQDYRSGKNWDIFGARVNASGEVLDPDGIPLVLGKPKLDHVSPVILEGFLVWQGRKNPKIWHIYYKIIGNDGEGAVEKAPIPVSPSMSSQISPAIAFNGYMFLIIWQDKRDNDVWEIYGARVTPWGKVIDKKGLKISTLENLDKWKPVTCWGGDHFLTIWMASPDYKRWSLYGRRINPQGKLLDLFEFSIRKEKYNIAFPAILFTGEEYLIVYEEEPEGNSRIFGDFLIPGGIEFLISSNTENKNGFPSLASIDEKILVVWQGKESEDSYQIYGQLLQKRQKEGD